MIGSIAAVASTIVIGRTWFSGRFPTGRIWLRRAFPGKTEEEVSAKSNTARALSVISSATLSLLLRFLLIDYLHITSYVEGVKCAVGLSCMSTLLESTHVFFGNGYLDLFLVNQVYNLLVMAASGFCIVYFG